MFSLEKRSLGKLNSCFGLYIFIWTKDRKFNKWVEVLEVKFNILNCLIE